MTRMSGYSTIVINHSARKITTVKNGNVFYIWFEDVRDITSFRTSGYIVQKKGDSPVEIFSTNKGGIFPDDFDGIIKQIVAAKPDWERELPDVQ